MKSYLHSVIYVFLYERLWYQLFLFIFTTTGGNSPTHYVSAPAENITRNIYVIVNGNGFCTLDFLHHLFVVVPGNYLQRYIQSSL